MHLGHTRDGPAAVSADATRPDGTRRALRIGLGGPASGSSKRPPSPAPCASCATGSRSPSGHQQHLHPGGTPRLPAAQRGVLPPERIQAVETGACPHTAIRDDIPANLEAVEDLEDAVARFDLILVESGGDNLTATFSKGLVNTQVFVIDVAGGDDIPRKGGPGVTTADLLVINKTDLAPYVGSDLLRHLPGRRLRHALPTHVRRMVVDSVVKTLAEDIWYRANLNQDIAFQMRWDDWKAWVAKHDSVYGIGDTRRRSKKGVAEAPRRRQEEAHRRCRRTRRTHRLLPERPVLTAPGRPPPRPGAPTGPVTPRR
ncbi:Urease accessory protein UreG [Streptomyces microflavus]